MNNNTNNKFLKRPKTGNLSIPILSKIPDDFLKKIRSFSNDNKKKIKNNNFTLNNSNNFKKIEKGTNFRKHFKRRNKEELKEIFSRKLHFNKGIGLLTDNNMIKNNNLKKENSNKKKKINKKKS